MEEKNDSFLYNFKLSIFLNGKDKTTQKSLKDVASYKKLKYEAQKFIVKEFLPLLEKELEKYNNKEAFVILNIERVTFSRRYFYDAKKFKEELYTQVRKNISKEKRAFFLFDFRWLSVLRTLKFQVNVIFQRGENKIFSQAKLTFEVERTSLF